MKFNTLTTERLLLRELTPEVYDHVFNSYTDQELRSFFALVDDEQLNQKKLTWKNGLTMFNKSFVYFQLLRKDTACNIGWCGFHTWHFPHKRAEIGYVLTDEEERDKGYMKEALAEIIRYGFNKMNLHRIEALIEPSNIPSLKLAVRFGFVKEGHLREHYFKDGKMEDSVLYALLKTESGV